MNEFRGKIGLETFTKFRNVCGGNIANALYLINTEESKKIADNARNILKDHRTDIFAEYQRLFKNGANYSPIIKEFLELTCSNDTDEALRGTSFMQTLMVVMLNHQPRQLETINFVALTPEPKNLGPSNRNAFYQAWEKRLIQAQQNMILDDQPNSAYTIK